MIEGKVWIFGDEINTDAMLPGDVLFASLEEQTRAVFRTNRPGWVAEVEAGDILIGGRNYGVGSGRPAARSLANLGIAVLLAESINGLFQRGAVNYGLIALECPGITTAFEEGQKAEVDIEGYKVRNFETGQVLDITKVPDMLLELMRNGGVLPYLEKQGLIEIRAH